MSSTHLANHQDFTKTSSIVYLGWMTVALFYFYQYILRVAPGVLVTDLRQAFHLTAEQFSTLGSFYLYAYALCQIPLGIIVDYVGVRKAVLFSITCCLLGTFLMAYATSLGVLQLSRILVGLGFGCAFMCALKIVVDYLPTGQRGLLMGATLTLGTLGALVAGKPLAMLSDTVGFRLALTYTTVIGCGILLVAYYFLPNPQPATLFVVRENRLKNIAKRIVSVLQLKSVMLYAFLAVGVYTPLSVLADLWGVAFLMQKYELSRVDAAATSMMMYVGLGVGCLFLPWLSEKYHLLNRSIKYCTFGVVCIFALLLYGPVLSITSLQCLLVLLGVCCGVEMLCFTGASHFTLKNNVGTTLGIVNTLNMLGGGLLQQLIGTVLDKTWAGQLDETGIRLYMTYDYTVALSVLFAVVSVCLLMCFYLPRDDGKKSPTNN